jgi:hypothetical protein
MDRCIYCGGALEGDVCTVCGKTMVGTVAAAAPQSAPKVPEAASHQRGTASKEAKPVYRRWWFWAIAVFALIIVIASLGGHKSSDDSSSTTAAVSTSATTTTSTTTDSTSTTSNEYTFGDTVSFDDLEITFGSSYTFTTIDNQYSEYNGKTVICVPVTVKNTSSSSKSLNMFYIKAYNPAGTESDTISAYFMDDDVSWAGEMRSGATQTAVYHILYEGDGDYYVELQKLVGASIEIELPITK